MAVGLAYVAGALVDIAGDTLRLHRLPAAPLERRGLPPSAEAPPQQPRAELDVPDRPYSPWSSLRPTAWLPVIGLADGAIELGFTVSGQDALGLHRYVFTPRYEFTQDEPLALLGILPLAVLLWVFARDRHQRIDQALALSHAYHGASDQARRDG